jgi:preprotein translocase SecE subunit
MANNEELSQDVKVDETQVVEPEKVEVEEKVENVKEESKKEEPKKAEKPKKKKKDKKPSKMAKKLKETSSELKKVTWPKFTTVLKQTGVVLTVTAAFLLVVFGLDRLCSWLVGFIV